MQACKINGFYSLNAPFFLWLEADGTVDMRACPINIKNMLSSLFHVVPQHILMTSQSPVPFGTHFQYGWKHIQCWISTASLCKRSPLSCQTTIRKYFPRQRTSAGRRLALWRWLVTIPDKPFKQNLHTFSLLHVFVLFASMQSRFYTSTDQKRY